MVTGFQFYEVPAREWAYIQVVLKVDGVVVDKAPAGAEVEVSIITTNVLNRPLEYVEVEGVAIYESTGDDYKREVKFNRVMTEEGISVIVCMSILSGNL